MLQIIEVHPNWPVYADVFEHSLSWLASWCPIWSDMTSVDTITQWREDWSSASVVNHTIVTNPTIRQPGFDPPHHTWSLLNRFRTCLGPCRANLRKWGLTQSPPCDCGERQTMNHTCPLNNNSKQKPHQDECVGLISSNRLSFCHSKTERQFNRSLAQFLCKHVRNWTRQKTPV